MILQLFIMADDQVSTRIVPVPEYPFQEIAVRHIISIHKPDPFTTGQGKSTVSCSRYTLVFLMDDADPVVNGRIKSKNGCTLIR